MLINTRPAASAEFHSSVQPQHDKEKKFWFLLIGCIGVVYGDIGTSPLYAFRESMMAASHGGTPAPADIYGILSLILWALIVVVTLKYVLFLLYADNKGAGGILSLMAMTQKATGKRIGLSFVIGMMGAALFYGDAAITPAISVLSAVEGLKLVTPAFEHFTLPIAIGILIALFSLQKTGTGKVSALFGPVMIVWFLILGGMGLWHIVQYPKILAIISPHYGIDFLFHHGKIGLVVLGAVFLAVTGGEALYADLGHFGRKPIQLAWTSLVLPCLTLNYMGQGALVLGRPDAIENPFFLMVSEDLLFPMVILATMATIIASQAVITGAYSLTQQAIQLGLLPRMEIRHMSAEHGGQIFMPLVNRLLLYGVLFFCLMFHNSSNLAAAYGISVTGAMLLDSILAFLFITRVWGRGIPLALAMVAPLVLVESIFLWANLLKIFDGGIVPIMLAGFLILLMWTWVVGTRYLQTRAARQSLDFDELEERLKETPPLRIPGTAIFLTSNSQKAPMPLLHNLRHNKILHERNIALTVVVASVPKLRESHRIIVEDEEKDIVRVILNFGFMETPDVPAALAAAKRQGLLNLDLEGASYFVGRRHIVSDEQKGLPAWQDHIYISMSNSAANATDFFYIPPEQVVEVGIRMVI